METRKLKMISTKSKLGHSLSQISGQKRLTIDLYKEKPGQATGLSPEALSNIFDMKQRGLSLELISQESDVELEVVKQSMPIRETVESQIDSLANRVKGPYEVSLDERTYTLGSPDDCKTESRLPPTTTEETKQPPQPTQTLPKPQHIPIFFYCCQNGTNNLHWVNLLTGEQSCHKVPYYSFKSLCRWSEVPGGRLLITGGGRQRITGCPAEREVVHIDTLREYAVSYRPPMHTARHSHAAVYRSQYLYVLGGSNDLSLMSECERYSCADSRWEVLPALPVACLGMSAVEVENSFYALGGSYSLTIQKLSLDSLTWEVMQLKLPSAESRFSCFKTDTQVYLMIKETLYSFTPFEVKAVKTLPGHIYGQSSYYSRGTLYFECDRGIGSWALEI
jgi:hypothetical protein